MLKIYSTILFGLLTISAANAQSSEPVRAHVPFAFTVQHQTLPAGDYDFTYMNSAQRLLIARRSAEGGAIFVHPQPTQGTEGPGRLVFECYGEDCQLRQVWSGSTAMGLQFAQPKKEQRVSFLARVVPTMNGAK